MSATVESLGCPRCHTPNDVDALQCTHCGEMLQKIHYGVTNRAAIVRDHVMQPAADPAQLSTEIHAYDPAVLTPLILRLLLIAAAQLVLAGLLFGISWLFIDLGPTLQMASAICAGLAAIPLLGAGGIWVVGKSRAFATRRLAGVAARRAQLKIDRDRAVRRSLRASGKSALAGEHHITAPHDALAPGEAFRVSLAADSPILNPTTYKVLAGAAAFTFCFLPQYQLFENFNGLECIQKIMTFVLRRHRDFMTLGSFAALGLPLLLANQVYLAWRPRTAGVSGRASGLVWNAAATLVLMLIVYLTASSSHETASTALHDRYGAGTADATKLADLQALVFGFQYGFFLCGVLVAASAVCGWLRTKHQCRDEWH